MLTHRLNDAEDEDEHPTYIQKEHGTLPFMERPRTLFIGEIGRLEKPQSRSLPIE